MRLQNNTIGTMRAFCCKYLKKVVTSVTKTNLILDYFKKHSL